MNSSIVLLGTEEGKINTFLSKFYNTNMNLEKTLNWEKKYDNPIDIVEIIGVLIDNNDLYDINIWVCLDNNYYIKVTDKNVDALIKYIYERYPR